MEDARKIKKKIEKGVFCFYFRKEKTVVLIYFPSFADSIQLVIAEQHPLTTSVEISRVSYITIPFFSSMLLITIHISVSIIEGNEIII